MTERSYAHQIVEFLKNQPVGYEFTSRSLYEDIVTTPGERLIPHVDQVSAALTRQRRNKALDATAFTTSHGGRYYRYTLVAPENLGASYRMGAGGSKGPRKQHIDLEAQPDLLGPPKDTSNKPSHTAYETHHEHHPLDVTPDPIQNEVRYHLRMALKAYKKRILHPAPEIAVKSIPTDILMDELSRRVKGMSHDEETVGQAKNNKQAEP